MSTDVVSVADLPAKWEKEAEEIESHLSEGEVWSGRYEVMTENAIELREALAAGDKRVPSSAYRLADWLGAHGFPTDPEPETNDVCDLALAKLQELQNQLDAR